ncbi:hypothetical protein HYS54_01690 [Candidatus Micrarchaeota archaeon]|nr:hypothetical protein [Candidatus Micrarchaeota archaeon]
MRNGFLFTLTTMLVFVGLLFMLNDVASYGQSLRSSATSSLSAYVITQAWRDVSSDITLVVGVNVSKDGTTADFMDSLPAATDLSTFIEGYGKFIESYYSKPSLQVVFLDSVDNQLSLSSISPLLSIIPFNIQYGYPDFGKNELQVLSPVGNLSALSGVSVDIHVTDEEMNESNFQWTPYQECQQNKPCLNVNVTVRGNSSSWSSPQQQFDATRQSQITIHFGNDSSNHWVKVLVGESGNSDPQNVLDVKLNNVRAATDTKVLLNSPDFLINYLSKLRVSEPQLFTNKTDWLQ